MFTNGIKLNYRGGIRIYLCKWYIKSTKQLQRKNKFLIKEVTFLGHIVSAWGLRMDPENIKAVTNFRGPRNKKKVQQYLGFLKFHHKFINKHPEIVTLLCELQRKY